MGVLLKLLTLRWGELTAPDRSARRCSQDGGPNAARPVGPPPPLLLPLPPGVLARAMVALAGWAVPGVVIRGMTSNGGGSKGGAGSCWCCCC